MNPQPSRTPWIASREPDGGARSRPFPTASTGALLGGLWLIAGGCIPASAYIDAADEQSYEILGGAAEQVTGQRKTFSIDRPIDTLRQRLIDSPTPVVLDIKQALDVAAENSREFQSQKEALYRAALSLTSSQHDFAVRYGQSAATQVSGQQYHGESLRFTNDLQASVNSPSGARLVAGFATTFLESLLSGGNALNGPQRVLDLTLTQPLLAGYGSRIVRENLTQAERDVVYAMRSFERFRSGLSLRIVQDYYNIVSIMENLKSVQANYNSLVEDRLRLVEMVKSGRNRAEDLDQARQSELAAENQVIRTKAQLDARLDAFKITLGLPTATRLTLDRSEFGRLAAVSLSELTLVENYLVDYALQHRTDYRTIRDRVGDAARQVLVAEDALRSSLDFTSAIDIPNEASGKPFAIDWDKVSWRAGFNLDLNLDRLPERNAYRRALIAFDAAIRAREQFEDELRADIRDTLRTLRSLEQAFAIEQAGVNNAKRRVDRTEMFMLAGGRERTDTRDVLEAKDALIRSQLSLTGVLVDFAVAKLQLLRDLDALSLEPKGLRYDPAVALPPAAQRPPARPAATSAEENER